MDPCSLMWKPDLPDIDMDKAMKFGEKMYDGKRRKKEKKEFPNDSHKI